VTYKESITEAMGWLGEQPDTIFIGQTVAVPGSYMYGSLEKVPMDKRVEFPVAENLQLGASFGMALAGLAVVTIFPRIDFLLSALDQLVNHVDKLREMSDGKMKSRMIIRTSVGPTKPLHGGWQHTNNYAHEIGSMCKHVQVIEIDARYKPYTYIPQLYKNIYGNDSIAATVVVEQGSLY